MTALVELGLRKSIRASDAILEVGIWQVGRFEVQKHFC